MGGIIESGTAIRPVAHRRGIRRIDSSYKSKDLSVEYFISYRIYGLLNVPIALNLPTFSIVIDIIRRFLNLQILLILKYGILKLKQNLRRNKSMKSK